VEEPFEALEEMELRKPYRVGVIGLGNMGARYLEALHANPNYWVRWVSDKNPARLAWASELIHEVIAGEDADQLMEEVEVDILGVFTLADARPHFIRAALRRRQHVIAEKPIAASIPEEEALLREVEASDRLVAVNLFNRNAWYHHEIQTFIQQGKSESWRSSTSPIKRRERCQTRNTDRKARRFTIAACITLIWRDGTPRVKSNDGTRWVCASGIGRNPGGVRPTVIFRMGWGSR
jgi:predicted dehydrogenase